MKFLSLFAFWALVVSPVAYSQVCNKDEILKLMAERNYINLNDPSFCVDFGNFPNVRVKMAEGNYDLNEQRELTEKLRLQDQNVKNLVNLLNSSENASGQKFTIVTKGIADGTFNSSKENDAALLKDLADAKGVISAAKIESVIKSQDPEGAAAIIQEIAALNKSRKRADNEGIKFSEIKDDSRLKSLMRNFFLARSRGEKLCQDIFGNATACESRGETSPALDQGAHCFAGCCDQRRGAIVDIVAPQKDMMSVGGTGNYKPPFKSPSRNYQGKLQMAGSMSVFDLPIKDDPTLDSDVLNKKMFQENLAKDRERFKEAMAGTGCENNEFAIDAVRRIYWTVKGMKESMSPALYTAITKNDFKTAYSLYEKATAENNVNDLNVFSALFSGANTNIAVNNRGKCPKSVTLDEDWGKDPRGVRVGKSPYTNCALITESESLKGKSIDDIYKMTHSGKAEQSVFVVQDVVNKNNFYLFDRKTNTKTHFSFDFKQEACQGLGLGVGLRTNKYKRLDDEFTIACMQAVTKSGFKMPKDFYPQAPQTNGVVPSDTFNCLDISKAVDHEMANQNPAGEPIISKEAEGSQKAYCKVQSKNNLTMNIDPKDLTVIGGSAAGKQGFMCTGCSSGMSYDAAKKKFTYTARQDSKTFNEKPGQQKKLAAQTWSQAMSSVKERPLTMASVKHMRSYVIPNCGTSCEDACACLRNGNIAERLKDPAVNVLDFSDLTEGNKKLVGSYPGDVPAKDGQKGSFACIYTPPVPHTCSYNPLGATSDEDHSLAHEEEKCPITEKLKSLPKTSKVVITQDMIRTYKNSCAQASFPSTEDQCESSRGGIMCQKKRSANSCAEPKPVSKPSGSGKATRQ